MKITHPLLPDRFLYHLPYNIPAKPNSISNPTTVILLPWFWASNKKVASRMISMHWSSIMDVCVMMCASSSSSAVMPADKWKEK